MKNKTGILFRLSIALFLSVMIFSGCGKKGPPEMIEKRGPEVNPVADLQYQVSNDTILLSWKSDYKISIEGFEIFMAKQNIKECQGCPVVFVKVDFLSPDKNQYQRELSKGYRYFFKIITIGPENLPSKDSETIKIEFQ